MCAKLLHLAQGQNRSKSILYSIFGGLMRGMATLSQGNQELLVVRDKVGRPPGELGVSKSMECDIFPSVLDTVGWTTGRTSSL